MIRKSLLAVSVVALALLVTSSAEAQNLRGLKFPASLQNVFLLRGDAVQEELGLNDEQKEQLSDLSRQLQQDAFEIFSGLQDLTPEEQKEQMPEVMEMVADKGKEVQEKVDEILDAKQQARLGELSLQARGAGAGRRRDCQALEAERRAEEVSWRRFARKAWKRCKKRFRIFGPAAATKETSARR